MARCSRIHIGPFLLLFTVVLCTSCSNNRKNTSDEMPALFSAPKSVALNTDEGYKINPVTGDSIQPIINSMGDTVKTGVPLPVEGKFIHPDSVAKPKIVPAGEPDIKTHKSFVKKIPENLTVIPVNKESLSTFTPGVDTPSDMQVHPSGFNYPTGIPVPSKGKLVQYEYPRPVTALPPINRGNRINRKILDENQGMIEGSVYAMLEDRQGNIWFNTGDQGVTRYNGKTFTNFNFIEREGIADNYVSSMLKDSQGNLWFGSEEGVYMYNGETCTYFSHDEGLNSTHILCIAEDSQGNIWFGTEGGGAARYNGKTMVHFTIKEGLPDNNILSIMEDRQGNTWFGTRGGISIYDNGTFTRFDNVEGLRDTITSILEDRQGNIWFGTDLGVLKYNGEVFIHYTEKDGFWDSPVNAILEHSNGDLWFANQGGGVVIYKGETFTRLVMLNNNTKSILEDSHGNMWFGHAGVCVYSNELFTYLGWSEGLSFTYIASISEDRQGNLWFGTGLGLSMLNGETFSRFYTSQGLSDDWVYSILEDSRGNLWLGTRHGGVNRYNGRTFTHFTEDQGLSNNRVYSMVEDSQGNLWFGTYNGGVSMYNGDTFIHYTENEGLSNNDIRSVIEDSQGNLWFGTYGSGVSKYDGETIVHYAAKEGLGSNTVHCIFEDSFGNLWFGTEGGGASIFNGETFLHITEEVGLSDNCAWAIIEDNNHNIWIGTKNGLNYLDFGSGNVFKTAWGLSGSEAEADTAAGTFYQPVIHTYGLQDGLKQKRIVERTMHLDSKNRIWMGNSGICAIIFDMNEFKVPVEPPRMQMDWIEIGGQYADYHQLLDSDDLNMEFSGVPRFYNYPMDLELSYENNHLTFHFSAIDWSGPHKLRFSYKMEGLNSNWSQPSEEAFADYRNMPSGTFTFVVQAIGGAHKWSVPFEYTFTIRPPWWRSWWAILFWILVAVTALIAIIRFRERNLKQRAVMLEQQVEEKTHLILEQRKEVDEMKSRFYTNISHEFRTPLTLLISPIEDAIKGAGSDISFSRKIVGIMHRNAKRLQNLINQLLDISRIESGKMELQLSKADLSEFVRIVASSFYSLAESRKIDYRIDIEPGGVESCFDADKTEKIITNLLSNAFKFSDDGGRISLRMEYVHTASDEQRQALVEVEDAGRGMEKDQLNKIFDRFYQVSDNETREVEGSGIGLALTRELLELMHGSIEVESTPGKGTTFRITFPESQESFQKHENERLTEVSPLVGYDIEDETDQLTETGGETEFQGEEVVLVIEDNPDLRSYIGEKLRNRFEVLEAENGEIGLRKAIEQIPDMVITDLMMPVMGGIEFCRKLKANPAINHIPVIMLTAKADKDSRIEGLEADADDYISKPFDSDLLLARVRNLISQRKQLRKHFEKEFLFSREEDLTASPQFVKLREIVRVVDAHLDDPDFELDSMAVELNMSRRGVFRKVKAVAGKTPHELVRIIRMKRAASLLRKGELNVTEVMYQVGMKNLSHFARSFRKYYGINPSEYRSS